MKDTAPVEWVQASSGSYLEFSFSFSFLLAALFLAFSYFMYQHHYTEAYKFLLKIN